MTNFSNLDDIIKRIINVTHIDIDRETLYQLLDNNDRETILQLGKYNINIVDGKDIHIGDRIYQGTDAITIKEMIRSMSNEIRATIPRISARKSRTDRDKVSSNKKIIPSKVTSLVSKPARSQKKSNLATTAQISKGISILNNTHSSIKEKITALKTLKKHAVDNIFIIQQLISLISKKQNNEVIAEAIKTLSKIGKDIPSVVSGISKLLTSTQNSLVIINAMRDVMKIAGNNAFFIHKMLNLLSNADPKIKKSIVISVGEADVGTRIVIDRLLPELKSSQNSLTLRKEAAKSLGRVGVGDPKAISEMKTLLRFERNKYLKACIQANINKMEL
jgi:Effector-associated domain 10/HEAT repeats